MIETPKEEAVTPVQEEEKKQAERPKQTDQSKCFVCRAKVPSYINMMKHNTPALTSGVGATVEAGDKQMQMRINIL